jgi:hypothetical protein
VPEYRSENINSFIEILDGEYICEPSFNDIGQFKGFTPETKASLTNIPAQENYPSTYFDSITGFNKLFQLDDSQTSIFFKNKLNLLSLNPQEENVFYSKLKFG